MRISVGRNQQRSTGTATSTTLLSLPVYFLLGSVLSPRRYFDLCRLILVVCWTASRKLCCVREGSVVSQGFRLTYEKERVRIALNNDRGMFVSDMTLPKARLEVQEIVT